MRVAVDLNLLAARACEVLVIFIIFVFCFVTHLFCCSDCEQVLGNIIPWRLGELSDSLTSPCNSLTGPVLLWISDSLIG